MKINTLLTERAIIQEQILSDSTYREFHAMSKTLMLEYAMNQAQIQDVFKQVAAGAQAGMNKDTDDDTVASNRTVLGKGADAASYVADKYNGLKQWIGKTGPVKGLDAMIDNLQQQVMQKAGGEAGKLSQSIEFYRELSKVPGMAMAVKFIIVSTAGLLTGGIGGIAVAAGLTAANKLLQGDKFSSAVMSAMETGGTVAAIQTAKDLLGTTRVGADYGNADDRSFGEIPRTDPNDLSNVDPNNIYKPLPAADAALNNQADLQAAQEWTNADAAGKAQIEQVTGLTPEKLQQLASGNYSDAATAAYNQNPDPSTGLPQDPTSSRSDYTAPDDIGSATEYKVTAADGAKGVGGIAKNYPGISAQDIIDYNNLSPDGLIKPGQVLQIPEPNLVSPASTNVWDRYAGPTTPAVAPVKPFSTTPLSAGYVNPRAMMREYIDIDTTARMWILHESLGKPRGNVYLSEAGVRALFKEVARLSMVNEGPMLDKLKGFNQKANAFIGKATAPIKQAAAAGWDSATNKITYPDLEMNWRRSAKLDKEASVDSEKVIDFLHDQGVKNLLIQAAFSKIGLKADPQSATGAGAGIQGASEFGTGFLQGLGPEFAKSAEALKKYQASKGGPAGKGRTKFSVSGPTAQPQSAEEPATATAQTPQTAQTTAQAQVDTPAETPPAVWRNNRNLGAPASTSPVTTPATATTPAPTTATPTDVTVAKTRTGGKVAGQVSQTPNAIRKRAARTSATNTPSAFGNMAAQLAARPTTSSTGGTTKGVAGVGNGVVSHTANPNNPNLQPTTTAAAKKTVPTRKAATQTSPFAGLGQPPAPVYTGRKPKKTPVEEPVAESTVDFGAMLFNRMKKQS
jgi:hypothetical protein